MWYDFYYKVFLFIVENLKRKIRPSIELKPYYLHILSIEIRMKTFVTFSWHLLFVKNHENLYYFLFKIKYDENLIKSTFFS